MTPVVEGYLSNPTFKIGNDETGGPAFFWTNPWTSKSEKIASLWWPEHPVEDTEAVEELFAGLCLCLSKGPRSPHTLEEVIGNAIDAYHVLHPEMMVSEIMSALNAIYSDLDLAVRKHGDTAHVVQMSRKS